MTPNVSWLWWPHRWPIWKHPRRKTSGWYSCLWALSYVKQRGSNTWCFSVWNKTRTHRENSTTLFTFLDSKKKLNFEAGISVIICNNMFWTYLYLLSGLERSTQNIPKPIGSDGTDAVKVAGTPGQRDPRKSRRRETNGWEINDFWYMEGWQSSHVPRMFFTYLFWYSIFVWQAYMDTVYWELPSINQLCRGFCPYRQVKSSCQFASMENVPYPEV